MDDEIILIMYVNDRGFKHGMDFFLLYVGNSGSEPVIFEFKLSRVKYTIIHDNC